MEVPSGVLVGVPEGVLPGDDDSSSTKAPALFGVPGEAPVANPTPPTPPLASPWESSASRAASSSAAAAAAMTTGSNPARRSASALRRPTPRRPRRRRRRRRRGLAACGAASRRANPFRSNGTRSASDAAGSGTPGGGDQRRANPPGLTLARHASTAASAATAATRRADFGYSSPTATGAATARMVSAAPVGSSSGHASAMTDTSRAARAYRGGWSVRRHAAAPQNTCGYRSRPPRVGRGKTSRRGCRGEGPRDPPPPPRNAPICRRTRRTADAIDRGVRGTIARTRVRARPFRPRRRRRRNTTPRVTRRRRRGRAAREAPPTRAPTPTPTGKTPRGGANAEPRPPTVP